MHNSFSRYHSELLTKSLLGGEPAKVASDVMRLSALYTKARSADFNIWPNRDWSQAYLAYFFPLNYLRLMAVFRAGHELGFFNGLKHAIDFGSGPGTAHLSALECGINFNDWLCVEQSVEAHREHRRLISFYNIQPSPVRWQADAPTAIMPETLALFSYSLNEVMRLPQWALDCEALMIVEPSTLEAGRNLQKLRATLIEKGFSLWAPCTHQGSCPLLTATETDWCHNRIHIEQPEWLKNLESNLPMKNNTLTYSYLLARKTPAVQTTKARIIGDTLYERGKVRQAVCRGPEREFLSWLTRHGEPDPLERGTLLSLPDQVEKKGAELRMPDSRTPEQNG